MMQAIWPGPLAAQAVYVVTKLGIADLLKAQHYLQKLFEVTGIAWDPPMETAMGTEAAEPGPGYVNQDPDVPRMARRKVPTVHPR